jgi:hypothetical protein
MFLRIGDQQFALVPGGVFAMGGTAFRAPIGRYAPADETAFLQTYLQHLEREITDVDHRLATIADGLTAPAIEPQPESHRTAAHAG